MDQNGGEMKGSIPITIGTLVDERRRGAGKRKSIVPAAVNNNGLSTMGDNQYETLGGGEVDDDDIELHEDDIAAFRHPMAPGEVRQNILFQDFGD
jgi:hypothetical protein